MHAQALTLAVLSGAALVHYYDTKNSAVDDGKQAWSLSYYILDLWTINHVLALFYVPHLLL